MFGWLKIRKAKIKPLVAASTPTAELPPAEGLAASRLDLENLPPHPLLALLPAGTLDRLLGDSAISEYPKGTVIYREGEPCDALYLILSGRCEARRKDANGETVVMVSGPGDMLGDRALLNHEPHRYEAVVATHAVLLRIPAQDLQGLISKDPLFAGRFSQTVIDWPRSLRGEYTGGASAVRRVVSLMPLSTRIDADVLVATLAGALRRITGQRVLVVRLGGEAGGAKVSLWARYDGALAPEFAFARQVRSRDGEFDELPVVLGAGAQEATAVAPLISHCAQHYPFVLLHVRPELSVAATLESIVESDLAFVFLQPSTQNLYDFQLLLRAVRDRTAGACSHLKPILCAEETIAAPEFHTTLRQLGHPAHSVAHGCPLITNPALPDKRFSLHINRLAREIARCRVGLALSSGGAKGLAHIGVIQVLEENGIEIDCVAGSSMGAYVGAIWASGLDGAMLEKVARETEGRWGLLRLVDPALPPRRGFLRTRRTVARLRRSIGDMHFSDLIRPLRIVSTRLDTLERVVFSCGEVALAVESSIAIPGVCVPVTIGGETYIDGGIADPLPVDVLMEMGIERIIAVNVIPPPERIRQWLDCRHELNGRETEPGAIRRFFSRHLNYGASGNILDTMMRAINGAQTRVAEASAREADVVLRPLTGDAVWHDFTRPQKYIALGRNVAEAQLAQLRALATPVSYESHPPLALKPPLAA